MKVCFDITHNYINKLKSLLRISKLLFTPVAILFLIYITWQSQDTIGQLLSSAQITYLATATIGWSLLYLFYPAMLVVLSHGWKTHLSFENAFYIHINRLPARYIPGGIWHSVARFVDFSALGLDKRQLTSIFLFENILSFSLAIFLGASMLLFYQSDRISYLILVSSIFASTVIIMIALFLVNKFILKSSNTVQVANYIAAIILLTIYWLLAASVFVLYLYAFFSYESLEQFLHFSGTYLYSWGIGYLAFFAPQGIGIFELVASYFIHDQLSIINTAVVIAGFRIIILFSDILVFAGMHTYCLFRRK